MTKQAVVAILLLCAACAGKTPEERSAANLYRDLQRLVTLAEAKGWEIDSHEIEAIEPEALMSLCRVEPSARHRLGVWLDERIEEGGGPIEYAFHQRQSLDGLEGLLELSRIRLLFRATERRARADCPFWLATEEPFRGRQLLDDRWLVSAGGGGKGIFISQAGNEDLSAGGAGRVLVGRSVGPRWTWLAGVEAGASASFPRDEGGDRGALTLGVDTVIPLVARYRLVNTFFELEAGYLVRVTEDEPDPTSGVHVGIAIGGTASRQRWIFPGAAFGLSYEQLFTDDRLHMLKLGFRGVIDLPL